ncbi:hypothetical protein WG66_000395 [Moniliophthora roreri]|nr:hypothetical protein WG66_000395 [Moniliophthora roreri]
MPDSLENSLGGLLGGTWANSYFFVIELIMAYTYFTRFRQDPLWLKAIVILTLLVDTASTINHYACAYMYAVLHWGDINFIQKQSWPFPVFAATTGASAFIVQQFLIYRFWSLTKNRFVTPFLILESIAAFAGALATAVVVVQHSTFNERDSVRIPVTIWLVFSAVADVSIAAVLIYTLHRFKSPFKRTKNMIKELTTLAIQTGASGSLVATIALIVYLSDPDGNISVGIAFTLGRIYAITMLNNLNSRTRLRQIGAAWTTGRHEIEMETGVERTEHNLQGIYVAPTALLDTETTAVESPISPTDGDYAKTKDSVKRTEHDIDMV